MEEKYSYSRLWRSMRNGDFEEEDVFDVVKETKHSVPKSKELAVSVASAARMIPRNGNNNNNYMNHEIKVVQQSSAPVSIPDWSKPSKKHHYEEDSDEEDEGFCKMPPHEFIARRVERRKISSFSVFEGIGRTLKGRDLSKVRNAVLTRTGFLESL